MDLQGKAPEIFVVTNALINTSHELTLFPLNLILTTNLESYCTTIFVPLGRSDHALISVFAPICVQLLEPKAHHHI